MRLRFAHRPAFDAEQRRIFAVDNRRIETPEHFETRTEPTHRADRQYRPLYGPHRASAHRKPTFRIANYNFKPQAADKPERRSQSTHVHTR